MAGVILQDRNTSANLEQVNKFNSTNQNMCSDAGTYPGVFLDRELFSKTYLRKTLTSLWEERFCTYKFRFQNFDDCWKSRSGRLFGGGLLYIYGVSLRLKWIAVYPTTSGAHFWSEVAVIPHRFFKGFAAPFWIVTIHRDIPATSLQKSGPYHIWE